MHGSRRAAGAVEASLAIALQSEAQQLDDEVAHVGLKRSRGLECAPSLKTSSSTEIARMQSSVHAAVTVSALDGAFKPTERVYRGQSAPRLAVLERAAIDLATAAGGRALAPGRCDRRPQGACSDAAAASHVAPRVLRRCELCSGEYMDCADGWRRHERTDEHVRKATDPRTFASLDRLILRVNTGQAHRVPRGVAAPPLLLTRGGSAAHGLRGDADDAAAVAVAMRLLRAELSAEEAERAQLERAVMRATGARTEQPANDAGLTPLLPARTTRRALAAAASAAASHSRSAQDAAGRAGRPPTAAAGCRVRPVATIRAKTCTCVLYPRTSGAEPFELEPHSTNAQMAALECASLRDQLRVECVRVQQMHRENEELEGEAMRSRRSVRQLKEEVQRLGAELELSRSLLSAHMHVGAGCPRAGPTEEEAQDGTAMAVADLGGHPPPRPQDGALAPAAVALSGGGAREHAPDAELAWPAAQLSDEAQGRCHAELASPVGAIIAVLQPGDRDS
ncbi:hypothetical protein KFE25_000203 [Diacronema lutheri]|uniref:Uncharacterized protein n=1 Tax=Diacronema lutheri TaxID=2081491 RepID=A0A8J5XRE6_DIALT|nr:hypothetical protein KFE25_000203 [Diacronema lutheri]